VYAAERGHLAKLADAMVRNNLDDRRAVHNERMVDGLEPKGAVEGGVGGKECPGWAAT
jgi:hypothetical protein